MRTDGSAKQLAGFWGEVEMAQKMKLVCPECAAQYEVDASVIPESGRDVQCSNCDNTWWQAAPGAVSQRSDGPKHKARNAPERPEAIATGVSASETPADATVRGARPIAESQPSPDASPAALSADEDDTISDLDEAGPAAPEAPRRTLDDAVLSVLRQEADRESSARRADGGTVESQSELGLHGALGRQPDEREAAVSARMAAQDSRDDTAGAGSTLPDIEEINTSLHGRNRVEADPGTAELGAMQRRRAGFRMGFTLTVLIAVAVIVAYNYADRIVASEPRLAPGMAALTRTVDVGRVWLDTAAMNATLAIQDMTKGEN